MREDSTLTSRGMAALALAAALGHLYVAAAGGFGPEALLRTAVFAAMAAICLPCAVHLWRSSSDRAWLLVGSSAALMVALHLVLMVLTHGVDHAVEMLSGSASHHHDLPTGHEHGHTGLITLTMLELAVTTTSGGVLLTRRGTTRHTPTHHAEQATPIARSSR